MAEAICNRCGGPITYVPDDIFTKCPYCDTQHFIDRSGVFFFHILPFLVDRPGVEGTFRRWAATKAVRNMDRDARIMSIRPQYFPVYVFKREMNGKERIFIEPARSTMLPGLHRLKLPAGELHVFDRNYKVDAELLRPDIYTTAYLPGMWGIAKEQALVYFPIWSVTYTFNRRQYDLVVDGSSGEVYVADFPVRKRSTYIAIAVFLSMVFMVEGVVGWTISPNFVISWGLAFLMMFATISIAVACLYVLRY